MSNAAGQAVRAGIREGSGNGRSSWADGRSNPMTFLPPMTPDSTEIEKLLKSQKIMKKPDKFTLFKGFFNQRQPISSYLNDIRDGASSDFDDLPWGNRLRAKDSYTADFLGTFLFNLHDSIELILPTTENYLNVGADQKRFIQNLHFTYEQARHSATTDLHSKMSSQFVTVSQEERERGYLVNGYLPTNPHDRDCICCGHGWCDEPNSNTVRARENITMRQKYEQQDSEDAATWAAGGVVRTNRGAVMTVGRKRPEPNYLPLVVTCHCKNQQCTTFSGPVPEYECINKCIDEATGDRYPIDPATGKCTCPICLCNDCPSHYTITAAQMFRANRELQANGGQANTAVARSTLHRPPPTVLGNYHATAESFGAIINRSAHTAVQGALLHARNEAAASYTAHRTASTHEMEHDIIQDETSLLAARELAESMHGDSVFARDLNAISTRAGPPSTFTNLPGNGNLFNTQQIASSSTQHRTANNRLVPMVGDSGNSDRERSAILFPEGVNELRQIEEAKRMSLASLAEDEDARNMVEASLDSEIDFAVQQNERSKRPKQQVSDRTIVDRLNGIVEVNETFVASASAAAKSHELPDCFQGVETSFLTGATSRSPIIGDQPSGGNVIEILDSGDKKSVEDELIAEQVEVDTLLDHVFRLSFQEAGVYNVVYNVDSGGEETMCDAAMKRVHLITDEREKAYCMTKELLDMRKKRSEDAPSPKEVCKMLDFFIGRS